MKVEIRRGHVYMVLSWLLVAAIFVLGEGENGELRDSVTCLAIPALAYALVLTGMFLARLIANNEFDLEAWSDRLFGEDEREN